MLFAQIVAAAITMLFYYLHGNIEFTRIFNDSQTAIILSIAGNFGAIIAITLFYIKPQLLQVYIAITLLLVGFLVLMKVQRRLTRGQIFVLGAVAAINKDLSRGGCTPPSPATSSNAPKATDSIIIGVTITLLSILTLLKTLLNP